MAFSPAAHMYTGPSLTHLVGLYIRRKYGYEVQIEKTMLSSGVNVHLRKPNVEHIVIPVDEAADIIATVEKALQDRASENEPMVDTAEVVKELQARYPGHSHEIREHILLAAKQLKDGQTIGKRQTPVISFWLMKPKWKDRGYSWKTFGTDGDFGGKLGEDFPGILRLVYFRTFENLVCQLAYVVKPANCVGLIDYESARMATPEVIDQSYEIKEQEHAKTSKDASEDILHTMEQFI